MNERNISMGWQLEQNKATYILRYYLPCKPIYEDEVISRRMEDLLRYCAMNRVSAVMLYVDLNPYWYYMPDDIEHTMYYIDVVKELAERLRKHGISYQLNYQNLFGSWDGGADLRYVNNWENYVDELGVESRGCACNIGERFREIAGTKLRLWAETKPDVIWIDDDIRFHNHRTSIDDLWQGKIPKERRDFGCFCEKHIALFNKKNNTDYSRDEIVHGILTGENHNKLRKQWLDFSGECVDVVSEWIEKTIHGVSPETRIAVMTSIPDVHSVEGRNWGGFLAKLSGERKPLLRPTFGPYAEREIQDFFESYLVVEQLKENIRYQYKGEFDFCPEIENTRFTRWSKSIAATGYQIMLSAFLGCKGVTLSIYDLEGCVLTEEPEFAELLREKRIFADHMAELDLWEWKSEGIGLLTAPERIADLCNRKKVVEMNELALGRLWDMTLTKMGIPCRYITPDQVNACKNVALDEYTVNLLTDTELLQLLSGGLLLDAGAAEVLNHRGFQSYVGVSVGVKVDCIAASEVLHGYRRTDGSYVRVPARIDGRKWNKLVLEGAEEISTLITPYGTGYPGFTRHKNSLGGTVYVYAGNGSLGDGFFTNYRVRMLKDICNDISENQIPKMNNGSYALMAVKSRGEERIVFVANLNSDKMTDILIEVTGTVGDAIIIDSNGNRHIAEIDGNKIRCNGLELYPYDAFVCKMSIRQRG